MMSKIAMNKVTIAQTTVASRVKRSTTNSKIALQQLKDVFRDISTANDYPLVGWPQLPDLPASGKAISIKLRSSACETKERNFALTMEDVQQNLTEVEEKCDALNSSTIMDVTSSRKVQAQAFPDVFEATNRLRDALTKYESKINSALTNIKELAVTATPSCGRILTIL